MGETFDEEKVRKATEAAAVAEQQRLAKEAAAAGVVQLVQLVRGSILLFAGDSFCSSGCD